MSTVQALSLLVISLLSAAVSAAPAPGTGDCSTLVISMVDCLSYVSNNSTVTKPEGECCSGLKTVMKKNPECLCEAFKNSAQFGVSLNLTKALTLPDACHVQSPPLKTCDVGRGPSPAPATPPKGALPPSPAPKTPSTVLAPAPAPSGSASGLTTSIGSVVALGFALISFI